MCGTANQKCGLGLLDFGLLELIAAFHRKYDIIRVAMSVPVGFFVPVSRDEDFTWQPEHLRDIGKVHFLVPDLRGLPGKQINAGEMGTQLYIAECGRRFTSCL
jgi:hypothetical protein